MKTAAMVQLVDMWLLIKIQPTPIQHGKSYQQINLNLTLQVRYTCTFYLLLHFFLFCLSYIMGKGQNNYKISRVD